MPNVTQEDLDKLDLLNRDTLRLQNEKAELRRQSEEFTIRRCQYDFAIMDPRICQEIATVIYAFQEEHRRRHGVLQIYRRDIERMMVGDGGRRLPWSRSIELAEHERDRAQRELNEAKEESLAYLRPFINLRQAESTRFEGKKTLAKFGKKLAEKKAQNPHYNPIGMDVHCNMDFTRIGRPEQYLNLHNPNYPRGPFHARLASKFRNIKLKGNTIAIRTLRNPHATSYALLMESPAWSKAEPGLLTASPNGRLPVTARIRDLARDAGHGQGYALVIQSPGENGIFYGIASYNCILEMTPDTFFETRRMGHELRCMVDFNFQLAREDLPMDMAIEVGTLLIEHARRYFGASLFRTQCSPLNSQYIAIMRALGLAGFQTIEAASYDKTLTSATWKFNTDAWVAAEKYLVSQHKWFITRESMEEEPGIHKRSVFADPQERQLDLAIVNDKATYFEDPAAYENMGQPMQPAVHTAPGSMYGVQPPQMVAGPFSESSAVESNHLGMIVTTPTGTSSGLGNSESMHSRAASDATRSSSHSDSSSQSSSSIAPHTTGVFGLQEAHTHPSGTQHNKRWFVAEAMNNLHQNEASKAMPPPDLPRRPSMSYQQETQSDSFSMTRWSDATTESFGLYSQSSASYDSDGKRPGSEILLAEPEQSKQPQPSTHVSCHQEEEPSPSQKWPSHGSSAMGGAPEILTPYEQKGKRPASISWETQPERQLQMGEISTYDRKGKRPASASWETQPERQGLIGGNSPYDTVVSNNTPAPDGADRQQQSAQFPEDLHDEHTAVAKPLGPDQSQKAFGLSPSAIHSSHTEPSSLSATGCSASICCSSQPCMKRQMPQSLPGNDGRSVNPFPPETTNSQMTPYGSGSSQSSLPSSQIARGNHPQEAVSTTTARCWDAQIDLRNRGTMPQMNEQPAPCGDAVTASTTTGSAPPNTVTEPTRLQFHTYDSRKEPNLDASDGKRVTISAGSQPTGSSFEFTSMPPQRKAKNPSPSLSATGNETRQSHPRQPSSINQSTTDSLSSTHSEEARFQTGHEQYDAAVRNCLEFIEGRYLHQQSHNLLAQTVPKHEIGQRSSAGALQNDLLNSKLTTASKGIGQYGGGTTPHVSEPRQDPLKNSKQSPAHLQKDGAKISRKRSATRAGNIGPSLDRTTSNSFAQPGPSSLSRENIFGNVPEERNKLKSFDSTPMAPLAAPQPRRAVLCSFPPASSSKLQPPPPTGDNLSCGDASSTTIHPAVDVQPMPLSNQHCNITSPWKPQPQDAHTQHVPAQHVAFQDPQPHQDHHQHVMPQQTPVQHTPEQPAAFEDPQPHQVLHQHMMPRQTPVHHTPQKQVAVAFQDPQPHQALHQHMMPHQTPVQHIPEKQVTFQDPQPRQTLHHHMMPPQTAARHVPRQQAAIQNSQSLHVVHQRLMPHQIVSSTAPSRVVYQHMPSQQAIGHQTVSHQATAPQHDTCQGGHICVINPSQATSQAGSQSNTARNGRPWQL